MLNVFPLLLTRPVKISSEWTKKTKVVFWQLESGPSDFVPPLEYTYQLGKYILSTEL